MGKQDEMPDGEGLSVPGLEEALQAAHRLAGEVRRGWQDIPKPVIDASFPRLAENDMRTDTRTMVVELQGDEATLQDVFDLLLEHFRLGFCVGYRANETWSGAAAPTPSISDDERLAVFEKIIKRHFSPRYNRDMKGFLFANALGPRRADKRLAIESMLDVYKAGYYLGFMAFGEKLRGQLSGGEGCKR